MIGGICDRGMDRFSHEGETSANPGNLILFP